ncbi:GNAT family protein [Piscinibacter sp. XHJ-5]|uniref:GNAT family N-acetyltransferase n=1 Tax=Piscinibacter sp. XHJ-5 TaxID=3037797 RepID=UPI002453055B|nr:GNAT family protein [Piscinibacter sp. XHJ-5]
MDALLIDVPEQIATQRLVLRCPHPGDGLALNEAVCESIDELRRWMPWAQSAPAVEESEAVCRRMQGLFRLRQDLPMFIFERGEAGAPGRLLGGTGLHRIRWDVRSFEVGYWCRRGETGRGLVSEAVQAISRMAFDTLSARRVEIRMDERHARSRRVAERCGFTLEGVLRRDALTPQGEPRNTCVYARVRGVEETDPLTL